MHRSINQFQKFTMRHSKFKWKAGDECRFSDDFHAFICIKHFKGISSKLNRHLRNSNNKYVDDHVNLQHLICLYISRPEHSTTLYMPIPYAQTNGL